MKKWFNTNYHYIVLEISDDTMLALYQGLTNYDEETDTYKQFSPDFFEQKQLLPVLE